MDSWRLFLGLWPTAAERAEAESHAAGWDWTTPARRTPPERLHVTLHFIGSVEAARVPALRQGLAVPAEPAALVLDRATVWPGGIAVVEATQVPAPLAALHQRLADALRALDLPVEERHYRPHITLARKAAGCRPPKAYAPLRWQIGGRYLLVRSLGGGRGYEAVQPFGA